MNAPAKELRDRTVAWADATPRVRRLWFIGKSANGAKRSERDVELAVELEPVPDSEESLIRWMNNGERWQGELQERIGVSVNLEWFDPDGSTPDVQKAVREASVLVYDRAVLT